jgi:hypothetical protein
MGIGTGIFLFAVGAIMRFAITVQTAGVNLRTVGDILMIVGVVGIFFSIIFWSSWGGFNSFGRRQTTVISRPGTVIDRTTVVDREPPIY